MEREPIRKLEDWIIRLDQADRDGKLIVGPRALAQILTTVVKAIKEK